jgi:TRAP-type mannitol/chloroaromatic compound transport system permease large subunit
VVNRVYATMSNAVLVALPMFIFMGLMLDESGVAERLMTSMQRLFGTVRGGLAITVTMIGIILAASTGIIGASVVLLGVLSLPSMMEQKYNPSLAAGVVSASGTLGILIPPSIMLVIMADQMALSVGDLFMAAVFPGVIIGVLYLT